MYKLIFILIILLSNWSISQEHPSLFQAKTIKKNQVCKVLEYDPEDSIHYFEQFPKGYYSKFDKLGRITESNEYTYTYLGNDDWDNSMFINYYMYDSLNNKVAFIQIHEEMESPISYLEVSSYNETDTIRYVHLKERLQINAEFLFDFRLKKTKTLFWEDTINISKRHLYLKAKDDSTLTMDIFLNKNGLKDSTLLKSIGSDSEGKHHTETITNFDYYENRNLKKVTVKIFTIKTSKTLYLTDEYYFLESELLDKMRTCYADNGSWRVRKFKYFYRIE